MTTLQDKLDNIYQTKLEIKSAIGTDSDVFSEYPALIRNMGGGGVSYSYLDERLSYYVETSDLESMGYITIEDVPQVDLSSYVTYTYLESKEYLTEIPDTYATYAAISEMGYITQQVLDNAGYITYSYGDSQYVSYAYIGDLNEITEYILGSSSSEAPENVYATKYELGSYVSKDELNNASYATESYVTNAISNIPSVDTSSYVTYTYLESKEYITINDVPTVDTSSYVTYTYLESKEYLTEIPDTYATYAAISEMGYVTSNDLPVINENIIPKENNTYTLGDSTHIYSNTYSRGVYLGTGIRMFSESSASSNDMAISLNGVSYFYLNNNRFAPNGAANNEKLDLGTTDRKWNHIYGKSVNVDATYTNTAYLQDTSYSSSILPKENNTYTLGDNTYKYAATYTNNLYTDNAYSGRYTTAYSTWVGSDSDYEFHIGVNGTKRFQMNMYQFFQVANPDVSSIGVSNHPWAFGYFKTTYTTYTYTDNIYNNTGKTRILINDRNFDLYTNNKKLINLSDYNGFVPIQSNFNLGSSNNAWGTTYTNNLYVNGSDIESRIAAIETYLGLNQ